MSLLSVITENSHKRFMNISHHSTHASSGHNYNGQDEKSICARRFYSSPFKTDIAIEDKGPLLFEALNLESNLCIQI